MNGYGDWPAPSSSGVRSPTRRMSGRQSCRNSWLGEANIAGPGLSISSLRQRQKYSGSICFIMIETFRPSRTSPARTPPGTTRSRGTGPRESWAVVDRVRRRPLMSRASPNEIGCRMLYEMRDYPLLSPTAPFRREAADIDDARVRPESGDPRRNRPGWPGEVRAGHLDQRSAPPVHSSHPPLNARKSRSHKGNGTFAAAKGLTWPSPGPRPAASAWWRTAAGSRPAERDRRCRRCRSHRAP